MIITISGTIGSGKSVTARLLAERLGLKHYSTGDFMREMARERGMDVLELSRKAEEDPEIDFTLDERQKELGKKEDDFVIDGRLSFHFIPDSIKLYLDADIEERAKRIVKDKGRDEENIDIKDAIKKIKQREESERKRYKKYYDFEINKDEFDFVLDNTELSIEETVDSMVGFLEENNHI